MQIKELEKQTDFLLSAALRKCGNLEDAQDITQDTMLAALTYLSDGKTIHDIRGWLLTVLTRKFYQKLRRKYQIPTVTIGECFDISDDSDALELIGQTDEAEQVRKSVAYLSGLHREVVVRYYMNGESVEKIANELGIPQGTVKSRLSSGREKIKKELDNMENYEKQSYNPITMSISNSGSSSIYNEPYSLIENDLIAQNLLYLAYNKPVTETELAKAIGIPMAYIEPIIKKLADGELMKRIGNKVYTDFRLSTRDDIAKYLSAQKQFAENNSDLFFRALKTGLEKLRGTEYYKRFNEHQQNAFELYFASEYIQDGLYKAFFEIYDAPDNPHPERPNGGKWIAFGHIYSENDDKEKLSEIKKHGIGGRRNSWLDSYMDAKSLHLSVFDLTGFPISAYYWGKNGLGGLGDDNIIKLFTVIETGANPEKTGFNTEFLKSIPWFVKCGILRYEDNGKAAVDIPVLSPQEWDSTQGILHEAKNNFIKDIKNLLTEYFKGKKQDIPQHIENIPLYHQYMWSDYAFVMAGLRVALKEGIIKKAYDYDDDSDSERRFPYAMVFIIDK